MHIDLNSCFATVEQQANPHLRGKPVAVAAYTTPSGCIIAPSVEAKELGIKVGMRVKDGKLICPDLIVLSPDPWKYRNVHIKLRKLLSNYTDKITPKSIDEFVLDLEDFLHLHIGSGTQYSRHLPEVEYLKDTNKRSLFFASLKNKDYSSGRKHLDHSPGVECDILSPIHNVAVEIKRRIKVEIGDWITVSIGIAPNRFLAKLAAGLNKPDGLDEINKDNYLDTYSHLKLTDLCGIKTRNVIRLNGAGIYTVMDFYNAPMWKLKTAFRSVLGYYWHVRLHGWEVDDVEFARRSYGNSYALPKPLKTPEELSPILIKLVEKVGSRLRRAGYKARGVHLSIMYRDWSHWHKSVTFSNELFDSRDIYKKVFNILMMSPCKKAVRELAVSTFGLIRSFASQLDLFDDVLKRESLVKSVDGTNERWGNFIITPAKMLMADDGAVPDRIAFGGVKELEEFTLG
jgi:DNA polymerase-4